MTDPAKPNDGHSERPFTTDFETVLAAEQVLRLIYQQPVGLAQSPGHLQHAPQ